MGNSRQTEQKRDRIGRTLSGLYILFMLLGAVVIVRILWIQNVYKPDPSIEDDLHPRGVQAVIPPKRGAILDRNGRTLALYQPMYDVRMDCVVQEDSVWNRYAQALADGLARIYKKKSPNAYAEMLAHARRTRARNLRLGPPVDHATLQEIKQLPILCKGQFRGGIKIEEKSDTLMQPYAPLGRKVIRDIEGKYGDILRGKAGTVSKRATEGNHKIQDYDSTAVKVENGRDIRTSLDIDIQDIADQALREGILSEELAEGGCALVMEVSTGALRAFVNLRRDTTATGLRESFNYALREPGEPGSVFKSVSLLSLLDSKKISLETRIPTRHGVLPGFDVDRHIPDYEREHNTSEIPIIEGYRMSSNYVFRYLVTQYFGDDPKRFIDQIYQYKLGEAFDFDLDGLARPTIPNPDAKTWSRTDLGSMAIGYSILVTPLHIINFYNAIANKGRMMKPYLIEDIESNGRILEKRGKSVLNESICSRATADSIVRAMVAVTKGGTGRRLKGAKATVAGKTGTSWRILTAEEAGGKAGQYTSSSGKRKYRATFVGFFPAEAPKYTVLVTIYTRLSGKSIEGGGIPARTARTIVDRMYSLDTVEIPAEEKGKMAAPLKDSLPSWTPGTVPDLRRMALRDALYAVEKAGYKCKYEGQGHVVRQQPAAGSACPAQSTVTLVLK